MSAMRDEEWERVLVCTVCEDLVWVVELPEEYLERESFVCLECRKDEARRKQTS